MGMAASQARYLALVARKSNCEYEGQQINQARLNLSNQSANLFNQMLGLKVPVPPSTQDYTKVQYSYKDGMNSSVISDWQQLTEADPDYNYVVTHYYYTDKYTGSMKKLSDPQVQLSGTEIANLEDIQEAYQDMIEKENLYQEALQNKNLYDSAYATALLARDTAQINLNNAQSAIRDAGISPIDLSTAETNLNNATQAHETAQEDYETSLENAASITEYSSIFNYASFNNQYSGLDDNNNPFNYISFNNCTTLQQQQSLVEILNDLRTHGVSVPIGNGTGSYDLNLRDDISDDIWNDFYDDVMNGNAIISSSNYPPVIQDLLNSTYIDSNNTNPSARVAFEANLEEAYNNYTQSQVGGSLHFLDATNVEAIANNYETTIANNLANIDTTNEALIEAQTIYDLILAESNAQDELNNAETELSNALADKDLADAAYENALGNYNTASDYYNSLQKPSYIGNSVLTLINELSKDQETEINQIITDMQDQNIDTPLENCFNESGEYIGGIYSFKLNGTTYYTTYDELMASYTSGTGVNNIDGQIKLTYYNATYIETKVEETERALLETDEYGRFSSVRFEDDTVKYVLNMETITDDVAYQDAMNQYYYENAKYDKTIQDINARTSIIHQEDQQLELRLKQLDTEQKALTEEMSAVQKIVQENVKETFKTFSN